MTYPAAPHSHEPLRVAAVDDHIYILNGILWTIQHKAPWIAVIATVATVGELLDGPGAGADVVLLDLDLGHTGFEVEPATNVALIRAAGPQVLILTATEDKPVKIRRAIQAGACGLVLKSDPEEQLIEALTVARTGELVFSGKLAHALITDPFTRGAPGTKGTRSVPTPRSGRRPERHWEDDESPCANHRRRHLSQTSCPAIQTIGPADL